VVLSFYNLLIKIIAWFFSTIIAIIFLFGVVYYVNYLTSYFYSGKVKFALEFAGKKHTENTFQYKCNSGLAIKNLFNNEKLTEYYCFPRRMRIDFDKSKDNFQVLNIKYGNHPSLFELLFSDKNNIKIYIEDSIQSIDGLIREHPDIDSVIVSEMEKNSASLYEEKEFHKSYSNEVCYRYSSRISNKGEVFRNDETCKTRVYRYFLKLYDEKSRISLFPTEDGTLRSAPDQDEIGMTYATEPALFSLMNVDSSHRAHGPSWRCGTVIDSTTQGNLIFVKWEPGTLYNGRCWVKAEIIEAGGTISGEVKPRESIITPVENTSEASNFFSSESVKILKVSRRQSPQQWISTSHRAQ